MPPAGTQAAPEKLALSNIDVGVRDMPNKLVDALHTNPDSARWPYIDGLIDLNEAGLIAPEVWRLMCALIGEYESELTALRERPLS